ncbi:hypothetical protein ABIF26_005362 [Bradyrhizobium elkanii]|uniref:Uncharacterized protein n=1 Tax=Bradyrhizobium elkanii TaxID=29448 RepID=A0A8I2C3Z9_BRAEL|nr:hypothetical protein [Bradyrhizobium elkanii]
MPFGVILVAVDPRSCRYNQAGTMSTLKRLLTIAVVTNRDGWENRRDQS